MEAYVEPLDRLREALRWFVAVRELLLMHVTTGPELRVPALQQVADAQTQPQNKAAIIVFTTPAEEGEADWTARGEELAESFQLLSEVAAEAVPPQTLKAPRGPFGAGLGGFIEALKKASDCVAPAFDGILAVLAPEGVTDPERWVADLRQLALSRSLSRVRFIILEGQPAPARVLATELAGLAETVDLRLDPSKTRHFIKQIVEGMKTAPAAADPHRLAGMAGPREAPPPRPGRSAPSPEVAASTLQSGGTNSAFASPDVMKALRVEALSASVAMQEGRSADAVQHQLKARDIAEGAGLTREATLLQLMLGGYLLQGGAAAQALNVFEQTVTRAKQLGQPELEVQSQMAKAGALLVAQRPLDAAKAYSAGATVAQSQPSKSLAIECYRMVGQILLGSGNEAEAVTAWQRALALAAGAPPEERIASSAPVAARDLAAVYRRHGLYEQANALEAQIARWETEATSAIDNGAAAATAPSANGPTNQANNQNNNQDNGSAGSAT